MIGHNYIAIYLQTFIHNAISKAFCQDVSIYFSAEQINPIYYSKSDKIARLLVIYLVADGHFAVKKFSENIIFLWIMMQSGDCNLCKDEVGTTSLSRPHTSPNSVGN